mmetsp:Transcript_70546/g.181863  ORF Transcript_70546/g.181863 Transcript_70546/m.181863 type:complete len:227 (-) Transcript_70546:2612-3292(-)
MAVRRLLRMLLARTLSPRRLRRWVCPGRRASMEATAQAAMVAKSLRRRALCTARNGHSSRPRASSASSSLAPPRKARTRSPLSMMVTKLWRRRQHLLSRLGLTKSSLRTSRWRSRKKSLRRSSQRRRSRSLRMRPWRRTRGRTVSRPPRTNARTRLGSRQKSRWHWLPLILPRQVPSVSPRTPKQSHCRLWPLRVTRRGVVPCRRRRSRSGLSRMMSAQSRWRARR